MQAHSPTMRIFRFAGLAMILMTGRAAWADEGLPRFSQSVEGPASATVQTQTQAETLTQRLDQATVDEAAPLVSGGSRSASATQPRLLAHPSGRQFAVFDAYTVISRDDDDDGFYHRIRVSFDPDVISGGTAWVYARLYLSLEGGPWNHLFTTDVFPITGEATDDAYDVVTRLLDGYPTGYYDVLVELYDADYDLLVDSYGPYEDRDLAVLPLEDSYRDSRGGGGALGAGLLLLALLAVTKGVRGRRKGGVVAA